MAVRSGKLDLQHGDQRARAEVGSGSQQIQTAATETARTPLFLKLAKEEEEETNQPFSGISIPASAFPATVIMKYPFRAFVARSHL